MVFFSFFQNTVKCPLIVNHIEWRTPNCRCPKGLFSLDSPAGISRDVTVSRWWFSCPDLVRGHPHPRECIQMRCFLCITQAAVLFPPQSAWSWSSRRRRLFLISRGGPRGTGWGQGHGSPVLWSRSEKRTDRTSLLPPTPSFPLPFLPHRMEWPFSEASSDSVGLAPPALSALRCSLTSHPAYERLN